MALLQPQQGEADDRDENVRIEDRAGIAGRKISRLDDLINVPACGPEQEQCRADDGGEPQVEAAPADKKPDGRKAEARESDLRLKRTVLPADEPCGISPKKVCMTKL